MNLLNPRQLRQEAARSLEESSVDYKKLISIHAGITLLAGLLLSALDYALEQMIGSTGGLSGVGLRSMLAAAQSVLQLAQTVALPFWQIGWVAAILSIARGESADGRSLLTGFTRFRPVLRLMLLQGIIYLVLSMGAGYAATTVFMFTPWAVPLMEVYMEGFAGDWTPEELLTATEAALEEVAMPLVLMQLAVMVIVFVPVLYRIRLAQYCLLDDESLKAWPAIRRSFLLTKKQTWALVKLDLSYWWFYGLEVLVAVVAYLGLLLPRLGVTLPGPEWIGFFGFYLLYVVGRWALYRWRKAEVDAVYVKAYEALNGAHPAPKLQLKKSPWEE